MITTLQNTPVEIDLLVEGKSTGWSVDGEVAIHEFGNAGYIYLETLPIVIGQTYILSYSVSELNNGLIRANLGTASGVHHTSPGNYIDTLVATGTNPKFSFYSDANARVVILDIKQVVDTVVSTAENSILFSAKNSKWMTYLPYVPDTAFSMFTRLYSVKNGQFHVHDPYGESRNNFYGKQYQTIVQFAANTQPQISKSFQSISYQSNQLLITTTDGIQTSLGQVSELVDVDFLKDILDDGINQVNIYDKEGIYSSYFLKDKNNGGIIDGADLKGNWITINLTTTGTGILKFFSVNVHSSQSKIGAR